MLQWHNYKAEVPLPRIKTFTGEFPRVRCRVRTAEGHEGYLYYGCDAAICKQNTHTVLSFGWCSEDGSDGEYDIVEWRYASQKDQKKAMAYFAERTDIFTDMKDIVSCNQSVDS